jgi:autotransporter-associated beta strand protein
MKKTLVPLAPLAALALLAAAQSTCSAAIQTWSGTAGDLQWATANNWVGGVAPQPGDSLVFNNTLTGTATNNYAAGTNFAGITIASTASSQTLAGNSINLSGDLVQNRGTTFTINTPFVLQQAVNINVPNSAATLTLGGAVTGGFGITKIGAGLAILANSSYTGGTIISGGTLRTGGSGNSTALFGTGPITLENGSYLDLRSTTATTFNNDLVLNTGTGGGTIGYRGNGTFSPNSITGTDTLGLTGDSANIVITPSDFKNFAGTVNAAGSNLTIRLASAFNATSLQNATVDLGATVYLSRQNGTNLTGTANFGALNAAAGSFIGGSAAGTGEFIYSIGGLGATSTIAGTISDGSTKTGIAVVGGNLVISSTGNAFSGASSVTGGTLTVTGSLTSTAMTTTVGAGGTLAGTGSLAGPVVENGTISPGVAGPGTLTVANALTFSSTSFLDLELNGASTTVGGGVNDLISGVTNLTTGGIININEAVAGSFADVTPGETWTLLSYSGTLNDVGFTLGTVPSDIPAGGALSISTATPGVVTLTYAVVPEPAQLGLLALAAPALLTRRRRA